MIDLECKELQAKLVEMRRDLHRIPEIGQILPETQAYVKRRLDELGIEYTTLDAFGDSGVIAYINRGKVGKTVALRADMDALPIMEETGVEYAATCGRMHGCGHDAHTAMLLGTAEILQRHSSELQGEVRLIFQTSEEISKGARAMVAAGVMEGVDAVYGMHIGCIISKDIPAGTVICCPGPIMASFDRFVVNVRGKGCHGSVPEKGVDPINIAAHVVLGLEAINAREFNACEPVVITLGKIQGGAQYNVIPGDVVIEGTTRTLNDDVRQKIARRIGEISSSMAGAFGGTAETELDWGAPPVVNDAGCAAFAANCAKSVVGEDMVITSVENPNMGGEDFAYFLMQKPGAFMFLSSSNPAKGTDVPHHNSHFNIDEDVLWEGPAVFSKIALDFLK